MHHTNHYLPLVHIMDSWSNSLWFVCDSYVHHICQSMFPALTFLLCVCVCVVIKSNWTGVCVWVAGWKYTESRSSSVSSGVCHICLGIWWGYCRVNMKVQYESAVLKICYLTTNVPFGFKGLKGDKLGFFFFQVWCSGAAESDSALAFDIW